LTIASSMIRDAKSDKKKKRMATMLPVIRPSDLQ
jgi:hypothetical protein